MPRAGFEPAISYCTSHIHIKQAYRLCQWILLNTASTLIKPPSVRNSDLPSELKHSATPAPFSCVDTLFVSFFKSIVTDAEPYQAFVRHAAPPVGFVGSVNQTVAQTFGRNVPAIGRDKQHFIIRKHDSLRFGKAPNGTTRDARPSPETTLIRLRHPWNDLRIF